MPSKTIYGQALIKEGGFSVGQTSYWLYQDYTCWQLLESALEKQQGKHYDIDTEFLVEAALIYILCLVANALFEQEDAFLSSDDVMLKVLIKQGKTVIPEVSELINCILASPSELDAKKYDKIMDAIYVRYVKGRFVKLLSSS